MDPRSQRSHTLPRPRWSALAALLAVIVNLVGATAGIDSAAADTAPTQSPGSYVALGDSFTSGPLIPNQTGEPLGCLRSDRNYPAVVAPQAGPTEFRDVSCGGASTRHMFESHDVLNGPNPPQLDALDEDTELVTLGIGGNDIGFGGIIESCSSLLPFGSPCKDQYTGSGHDEISDRIAETAPKVATVLDAIEGRSPAAQVLVVGYPAILPHSGSGCWPSLPIAWGDVPYLRDKHIELNAMLANQAAAHGATYVDTYTPSNGHDACAWPTQRWVEPIIPASLAAPVHPNERGMAGMAAEVLAAL